MADYLDHVNDALNRIQASYSPIHTQASLSLCCENIAQSLADAAHIAVDADTRPLKELTQPMRERSRHLAEQAIDSTDPSCYDDAILHTVSEMVNGEYRKPMGTEELVREALATFLSYLAQPRVGQ